MDSKDENVISDSTAVEQSTPLISLPHKRNSDLEVPSLEIGGSGVSPDDLAIVAASDSNANNTAVIEETSSACPCSDSLQADKKGNSCQSIDSEASENSSFYVSAENICDFTKAGDQDTVSRVSQVDLINNIRGILDSSLFKLTTKGMIPPVGGMEKGEGGLVGLPGALRTVRSLKDISAKKTLDITRHWVRARHLSESDIYRRKILAAQNMHRYLNTDEEHHVDSSKSSLLEPGSSSIPHITENSIVATTAQTGNEESTEDYEKRATFYISSSSIPGMKPGSQWSSVSGRFQMPTDRPVRQIVRQESREPVVCLGTQKCHYIVLIIGLLTAVIGCVVYHLNDWGIGPEVLRPIGASTAFISFAVCVFSSIYISYLKNYPQTIPVVPNYELLGDVDSVMAMHRTSDPALLCAEDGYYGTDASDYNIRQTQSADILDRRGYGREESGSQTEVKRYAEESGTAYSSQPQKKFKSGAKIAAENVVLTSLGSDISTVVQKTVRPDAEKEVYEEQENKNSHEEFETSYLLG